MSNTLLTEIESFLADKGMSASYFGRVAVRNCRLVERLRRGDPILTRTESQVRMWMQENRDRTFRTRGRPYEGDAR